MTRSFFLEKVEKSERSSFAPVSHKPGKQMLYRIRILPNYGCRFQKELLGAQLSNIRSLLAFITTEVSLVLDSSEVYFASSSRYIGRGGWTDQLPRTFAFSGVRIFSGSKAQ